MKCNPDEVLIRSLVLAGGCGFDCASLGEITLVLRLGAAPTDIIFANPSKPVEAIVFALTNGISRMTYDSTNELDKILDVMASLRGDGTAYIDPHMVLRLRVPVSGPLTLVAI